jgi:cytoskeleton protein RodZ
MSDAPEDNATPAPRTAGGILREARQAQGVHIAALAATIKVAQRKLESLEADRLDELPDATFTRALAQTVCRALKIDPAPVLALLPQPSGLRLEHVAEGLKEPFRERAGQGESTDWMAALASPAVWGVVALVVLTAVVYLMPQHWLSGLQSASSGASAPAPAASATMSSTVVPTPVPAEPAASAAPMPPVAEPAPPPVAPPVAASGVSAAPVSAGPLRLRTIAPSWIEVHDARAQVLLSRVVEAGEAVDLDGAMPLRVKIGNARGTEVVFRGRALDLAPNTRDNVARLELR